MRKPVATLAMLLIALMPAAAAPIPAVKSAQCPPRHIVSGGYCTPLFRGPPGSRPEAYALPKQMDAEGQQLPRSQTDRTEPPDR
jgi:hypothetical protein